MRLLRRRSTDSDRLFAMSLVAHIVCMLVVAVALAVALGVGLWWAIGQPSITTGKPWTAKESFDFIKIVLVVVGGIGGVIALVVSYRKQRLGEAAETREDTRLFGEDFARATEQLGSAEAPVRLAGMYTLERLGQNTPQQQQTIVNVLCAYLRMPYNPPEAEPTEEHHQKNERRKHEREVRLTAQRIFATNLRPSQNSKSQHWKNINLDLTGATLLNFDLAGCQLHTAHFYRTQFDGPAQFQGTWFSGPAEFQGAQFSGCARFKAARFDDSAGFEHTQFTELGEFSGTEFNGQARFEHAQFTSFGTFDDALFRQKAEFGETRFSQSARFQRTWFNGNAGFEGTQFNGQARFEHARFKHAQFQEMQFTGQAWFTQAQFRQHVRFQEVQFNEHAYFEQAEFNGTARFQEVQFNKNVGFEHAEFDEHVVFEQVQVSRSAQFQEAQFNGIARFNQIRVRLDAPDEIVNARAWPQGYEVKAPRSLEEARQPNCGGRWGYLTHSGTEDDETHTIDSWT